MPISSHARMNSFANCYSIPFANAHELRGLLLSECCQQESLPQNPEKVKKVRGHMFELKSTTGPRKCNQNMLPCTQKLLDLNRNHEGDRIGANPLTQ